MQYTGYHGTDIECAKKIQEEKHYKPSTSDKEWLGKGVYFFKDDKHQAYMFIKFKNRKCMLSHKKICVLETIIISSNIINLILDDHKKVVKDIAKCLKKEIKEKLGEGWGHPEGYILDFMYNHRKYDFVMAPYNVPKRKREFGFSETQIQICVKNNECIQKETIRSVNCDGYASI